MTDETGPRRIKCPHCGWLCTIDEQGRVETGRADVTRGVRELVQDLSRRIQSLLADTELEEARAWLDTQCPHCRGTFRYNVRTEEVKR